MYLPEQGTLGIVKESYPSKDPDLTPEEKQEIHNRLVEFYKLEVEDRDSARQREVEMVKAGSDDWMMNFTGVVGLGGFVLLLSCNSIYYKYQNIIKSLMIHTTGISRRYSTYLLLDITLEAIAKKGR